MNLAFSILPRRLVSPTSCLLWALSLSACGGSHWERALAPDPSLDPLDADRTERGISLDVYHDVVRDKVMNAFSALNRGDAEPALAIMSEKVVYEFEGQHALGGTRVSKAAVRRWFARLLHLVPSHFSIRELEVSGGPANTRIYLQFEDRVTPLRGKPYVNHGIQVAYLHWGEAYRIHTYIDTALLKSALEHMHQNGIAEAGAPPITD